MLLRWPMASRFPRDVIRLQHGPPSRRPSRILARMLNSRSQVAPNRVDLSQLEPSVDAHGGEAVRGGAHDSTLVEDCAAPASSPSPGSAASEASKAGGFPAQVVSPQPALERLTRLRMCLTPQVKASQAEDSATIERLIHLDGFWRCTSCSCELTDAEVSVPCAHQPLGIPDGSTPSTADCTSA